MKKCHKFTRFILVRIQSTANGASTNPCAETYAGAKAFSEPETVALAEFVKTFDNIRLYLSFHSYGQMLLFPYVNFLCEFLL